MPERFSKHCSTPVSLPRSACSRASMLGARSVTAKPREQLQIDQLPGEPGGPSPTPGDRSAELKSSDIKACATFAIVAAVVAASRDVAPEALSTDDVLFGPGADDVERFVFLVDLEMAFHFGIPEGTVERCETVGDLVRLLKELEDAR